MSSIVEIYSDAVYENLKPARANWQPLAPVELGTIGVLDGEIFKPAGNVKSDFGVDIGTVSRGSNVTHIYFTTAGNCTVKMNAKGAATVGQASVNASIDVQFSSSDAVFFNGAGCTWVSVADKISLGQKIMGLGSRWNRDWAIIVDYIEVQATTIAISGSDSSSITFQAGASAPQIDLANVELGLSISASQNIGYQLASSSPLRPLITLAKVQTSLFSPDVFDTTMSLGAPLSGGRDFTQDKLQGDRTSASDTLYFGTLF